MSSASTLFGTSSFQASLSLFWNMKWRALRSCLLSRLACARRIAMNPLCANAVHSRVAPRGCFTGLLLQGRFTDLFSEGVPLFSEGVTQRVLAGTTTRWGTRTCFTPSPTPPSCRVTIRSAAARLRENKRITSHVTLDHEADVLQHHDMLVSVETGVLDGDAVLFPNLFLPASGVC